jgi:hypothetical protein
MSLAEGDQLRGNRQNILAGNLGGNAKAIGAELKRVTDEIDKSGPTPDLQTKQKKLTKALDEFLSSAQPPSSFIQPELSKPTVQPQESNQDDFIEFQPGLLMELDEVFDDRKRKVIKTALVLIKENTTNDPASAMKLYSDISKIVKSIISLCEIIGLSNLNELLTLIDKKIMIIIQSVKENGEFNESADYFQLFNQSIELCWDFRNSVISNCSEEKFMKDKSTEIYNIKQKLI